MKRKSSKEPKLCVICDGFAKEGFDNDEFLYCKKHRPIKKENKMDCPVCGCQDTKFVNGVSKATGKPWSAYDCQNPQCKNEKGYATRTFVKTQPNQVKFAKKPVPQGNLGPTIADIMKELKKMQEFMGMNPPIEEINKELSCEADQATPF